MSTQDIIKILPIEETLKVDILSRYDTMDKYEKLSIDEMAWNAYYSLYDEKLKENLGVQYENVKKGEEPFGDDYYARALKKTKEAMKVESQDSVTSVDLTAARKAMEVIVREIQASKIPKKHPTSN